MPSLEREQHEILPLKLWSSLQHQLAACGRDKGSPQQWTGTIRNLQKKGVSATEIEWSGIELALDNHPAPLLHIDDLLALLRDKPPSELVLQRLISKEYTPLVHYVKQTRPDKLPPITARNGNREFQVLHYMDRTFGICIWLHVEVDIGLLGRHIYWLLSVPRGRKKLASAPVSRSFSSPQEAMIYGRVLVKRMAQRLMKEGFVGQTKNVNLFPRYVLPGGKQYTEWLITAPNLSVEYWGHISTCPISSRMCAPLCARPLKAHACSCWRKSRVTGIRRFARRNTGIQSMTRASILSSGTMTWTHRHSILI